MTVPAKTNPPAKGDLSRLTPEQRTEFYVARELWQRAAAFNEAAKLLKGLVPADAKEIKK